MKIAGRKNDGAWFRTNKELRNLSETERTDVGNAFRESCGAKADAVFADIQSLAAECGIAVPGEVTTGEAWQSVLIAKGIPRQVWKGHFTFTTYARTGAPGAYKFPANYQSQIHFFAKDMRRFFKYWLLGRRELKDLMNAGFANQGNPGGIPDGQKDNPV